MTLSIYELKQAWASLSKKPSFIATVVTTMGTTLGALLCVLTLGYLLLVKSLPYPEQDRLYKVEHALLDSTGEERGRAFTYPGLMHLYENQDVFDETALIYYGEDVLTSQPSQPTLPTGYVTPEWFALLDAQLALGRSFEATEAINTNQPVVVLSHQLWQREYASDPDIIGKKLDFSGTSFKVIGVLAKNFVEPQLVRTGTPTEIWFPWDYNQGRSRAEQWGNISGALTFVGKLKSNLTEQQAEQAISPLVNDKWQQEVTGVAFFADWRISMSMEGFHTVILGDSENAVYLLMAGVFGLMIIAVANIANLFMSRTAEQQRQLAIFAALGAKKSQLFKTLLAETSVLMALSVLLALIVSMFGFYVMQEYLAAVLPRVSELNINGFTLSAALVFAAIFACLFAALSRKMINYRALNSMLQSSGKGTGIQVSKKTRQVLIISQVAIATVLVFANISLFKEAYTTITEPKGYNTDNKIELTLSVSAPQMPAPEEVKPVITQLRQKLTELPQVESVSLSSSVLRNYSIRAMTSLADNSRHTPQFKRIDEMYFDMLGMELLEGDNFTKADVQDTNRVMIVNDVFAKQLTPEGNVIGMQISPGGDNVSTVIGVVKGVKLPGRTEIPPRMYVPASQATTVFTVNLLPGQSLSREQAAKTIAEVNGLYALFGLDYFKDIESRQLFTQYATAVTTAVLAILTFFLAGVGLYGILSYGTQMRRFEFGTRMAIGAKRKHLVGLIIKDNSTVITMGVVASIVILTAIYLFYDELFMSYLANNLVTMFVATVVAITALSLFACYWPLRQFINQPAVHSLRGSD